MKRREVCGWLAGGLAGGLGHASSEPAPVPADLWRAWSRLGHGPGPAQVQAAWVLGGQVSARDWALAQLDMAHRAAASPPRVPAELAGFDAPLPVLFERFREEREQRRQGASPGEVPFGQAVFRQAAAWRLHACSQPDAEPPLLARMTEFCFNHLNVSGVKGAVRPFVGHYLVHAIRAHALGQYEDLLLASARHPAMLFYLNQAQSVAEGSPDRKAAAGSQGVPRARGLNENYAREVMELHTLGVDGGYTQADITELARMLSGWTVDPRSEQGFRFAVRQHDGGAKRFMGRTVEAAGEAEGEWALRWLARQPATARRVALRLAQWFVADHPPAALVDRLAERFLATQGDLAGLLRVLIQSPETWDERHRLFKTPWDYACSVLALTGGVNDDRQVRQTMAFLSGAGQPLLGWQTPDGYRTDAATWLSPEALSRRADFALQMGRGVNDATPWLAWLTPATRERIEREPPAMRAGLAMASPDFMWK